MDEAEVTRQNPVEDRQQSQMNVENTLNLLDKSCSVDEKIENSTSESRDVSENLSEIINKNVDIGSKEVSTVPSSFENQIVLAEQNEDEIMKVDEKINVPSIVIENVDTLKIENNDCVITPEPVSNDNIEDMSNDIIVNQQPIQLVYEWNQTKLICSATKEFKPTDKSENFTKGVHWSPDGTCVMVPSEDFKIRIFDLPRELYSGDLPKDFKIDSFQSSLFIKEGGMIYDCCWFPYMNSWDPTTCCILSTSQGSPIHLWDAFTGKLRATYRAYNQVDEVEAAISVQFTDSGTQIWSGFKNALRTFDTNIPGRQTETIYLKKDFPNVTGLVSCIRENPAMSGLIAFGTYSKSIGLYKNGPLCSFQTNSGVTQIEFSPCGTKLYSAVRRSEEFLCWDLRNPGTVLYALQKRQANTNQRIYFNLSYNGEEVVSGGTDGAATIWQIPNDLQVDEDLEPRYRLQISNDCVNGVSLHKNLPILAVSTGSRICDEEINNYRDNSVRFYWLGGR